MRVKQLLVLITGWPSRSSCWTSSTTTSARSPSVVAGWTDWGRPSIWWLWRTCVTWASLTPTPLSATSRAATRHSLSTRWFSGPRAKRCCPGAKTTSTWDVLQFGCVAIWRVNVYTSASACRRVRTAFRNYLCPDCRLSTLDWKIQLYRFH